ncbi:MAG: hypothetical protein QOK14_667 [Frankiaceae bacterium]|nr:hypothetical protein [Frankiaceae bacterium]
MDAVPFVPETVGLMTGDIPASSGPTVTPRGTAVLSSPGTLHGRLQRGLGRGAFDALGGADAADAIVDCVCHDPRWDPQCESRESYYAFLIQRLAIPLDAVRAHLFSPDDVRPVDHSQPEDFWRTEGALAVLGAVAAAGHGDARSLLREYAVTGASWQAALYALTRDPDPAALGDGLAEAVLAQLDEPALVTNAEKWAGPWNVWAQQHPRVADALLAADELVARRRTPPPPDVANGSREELLQLARSNQRHRLHVVREFGRRRDPVLVELAEETLVEERERMVHEQDADGRGYLFPGVFAALSQLPPDLVLPHARRWAPLYPHNYQSVAILGAYGSHEDGPSILAAYTRILARSEWEFGCELPAGLARLGMTEAVPLLLDMWHSTPYACARPGVFAALVSLDSRAASTLAGDALWDSEEGVRAGAAAVVQLTHPNTMRWRNWRRTNRRIHR